MDTASTCTIKVLPQELWVSAATRASEINPANATALHFLKLATPDVVISPEHLALLTAKYWGSGGIRLTVGFLDNPPVDLRTRILSHMNAWGTWANVEFVATATDPQVRINRAPGSGYWSYLGTDILQIQANQPTMNLDSFTMNTPDSEFHRVVRHETGHTLGFPHEHMRQEIVDRIDREKAIAYFMSTQGWSRDQVIAQVLTPLNNSALIATAHADPHSIMCYWLPASIMKNGVAVDGGTDIDAQDAQFAASVYPRQPRWQCLQGTQLQQITVANNADGRLEAFALGGDKAVYHIWQTAPNGGWGQWASLAGHDIRQIVVGRNADGRLEVFALGGDRAVYHIWQTAPNGGWGQWASLAGHDIQQIVVGRNADGRLEVFALGGDRAVYHIWQTSPNGTWGQWASLAGHDIQQIAVANNADGRLEVFALGGDKAVYHIWQTAPNGNWGQWGSLAGHDIRQIVVGRNADGRLEVFALGGDRAVYHIWQSSPNGNWWQWASLAGHDIQQIAVANNADGRLEVFALGGDKAVYHIWQTAPNGNWGQWGSLAGHDIRQIVVGRNADGRLETFALGGDRALYHIWQTAPNNGWLCKL